MARRKPRITAVVFDLDDTLYDCYRQRVLGAHRYACREMLQNNLRRAVGRRVGLEELLRLRLRLFRRERNLDTLDRRLCHQLGVRGGAAARLARVGRRAYFGFPVGRLHLFPETRPTLKRLHGARVRVFILTAGHLKTQKAKARVLGLDRSPYVRNIFFTGLLGGRGKRKYLRQVLKVEPDPRRVLVVGDRPDSEIREARALGMWTVRRRGGEFARYQARNRLERAHFTVRRLSSLFRLGFDFRGERGDARS
jgi:FMN phosphatase YigB (HAD superfamily)